MADKTKDPNGQEEATGQDDKQPQSARESIRAAFAEQKEKEEKALKAQEKSVPEKKEETKVEPKVEAKVEDKVDPKSETKVEDKEADSKTEVKKDEQKVEGKDKTETEPKEPVVQTKAKAPFGASKEVRADWDKWPETAQKEFSRLLKESLDTKAENGRKGYLKDVDQALAPLMPELQQLKVTPAQFVKRLVDYTYALANPQQQYAAIAQLAHDYGIDLRLFGQKDTQEIKNEDPKQLQPEVNPELNQKLDSIINRFQQLESTQKTDNEKAAVDVLNQWAGFDASSNEYKTKPYFPYVRQMMHSLIASGAVPLKDGKIDLDGAYDAACYAHPEIREHMVEEQQRSAAATALQQQQAQQQQIARIKNAGSSIKPGAPAPRSPNTSSPKTNSKGQPLTVRDSLRQAIAQMREQ